ncbi:DnaB-like helicase C-terminal domain-containing protein [Chromobacterium phragmitis]|uniref:DnaB-like helicase C-terminal domain-containing protein n=1 Tax=Chromobacterium phragmitis TaxID=2202141 RepID=A0ABV0J109_9NEIS
MSAELAYEEGLDTEFASSPVATFEFDAEFQSKIAALMLRDSVFMSRIDGLVEPAHFEDPCDAVLANMAIRYYKVYRKSPDRSIQAILLKEDIDKKIIRKEFVPEVIERLKKLNAIDISDRDFVVDNVAQFARCQAMTKAIESSIHKLDKRDFAGIEKEVQRALNVGANSEGAGYDFFEEIENRTTERKDRAAGKILDTGVTTGYAALDDRLYQKGWGRQELAVLMGPAKAGKTTAMINFAKNACGAGYNVLYVTLEVAAKIIAARLDASITRTPMMALGTKIMDIDTKIRAFRKKAGLFKIHEYPTGTLKVSELRRLILQYRSQGIKFDLIVIDYADLMAPEVFTQNPIENSKSIYVNLRGMAQIEDVAILTATQTNREGAKAGVVTMTHVAEDFNKIRIADVVISLNRNEEDIAAGQARLYFAASRNQAGNITVVVKQDMEAMIYIDSIVEVI